MITTKIKNTAFIHYSDYKGKITISNETGIISLEGDILMELLIDRLIPILNEEVEKVAERIATRLNLEYTYKRE